MDWKKIDIGTAKWRNLLGSIGFIWSLIYATIGGFAFYHLDVGALTAIIGFSSALIGVGVFTNKGKNEKTNSE